ncbi:hypothetical protein D9757_004177 [Collybiopsis confluens]|uniref:F-box domain-containing protein n=1 Tax=Collybiopsis confluens TaxID=2823264 RepID=A0A8H5HUV6_9AGAR|nr:hypothetical protein D9757_004177 [Collybiopsis confluens]
MIDPCFNLFSHMVLQYSHRHGRLLRSKSYVLANWTLSATSMPGLVNLPLDTLFELVALLDVYDSLSLSLVSHKLYGLRSLTSYWHVLVRTLQLSSVPLACPPHSELIPNLDLQALVLRTLNRQRILLSSSPRPIRVHKYLQWTRSIDSICSVDGTEMYLTCDINDGMAKCWDLSKGKILGEVYVGRNILAKSTLPLATGKFLVCLLVAESLQEFVANSVVCLEVEYELDPNSTHPSSFSYHNVKLSIRHRSPLDSTYPAMYPSCAINADGILAVVKMATTIHIIGINMVNGARCVVDTDLTELEIDSVDVSFNNQDLFLAATNPRASWVYRCSKDYLPYNLSPVNQRRQLELSKIPPILTSTNYSFERCGFYASSARNFAMTAYYATDSQAQEYTECCFWDMDLKQTEAELAHRVRLPGLQFFEVPCSGSESGTWGVFVCDTDVNTGATSVGHDFEVDVGVTALSAGAGATTHATALAKVEILLMHYDPFARTSTLYRPQIPSLFSDVSTTRPEQPYSWIDDIKSLEFDERLGVLYIMLNSLEGGVLCAVEFV